MFASVRYYLGGFVFFGGSVALNLVCALGLMLPARNQVQRFARRMLPRVLRLYLKIVAGLGICRYDFEELGAERLSPRIWVMNHPTIMDALYLLVLIPNGTCIYKGAIGENPFYGFIARLAGHLPNVAGPDMIRAAVERIQSGENVIIFPEGTRTSQLDVDRFKGGYSLIASRAGVPIELLWIDNPASFLTREVNSLKPAPMPAEVVIRRFGRIEPRRKESASSLRRQVALAYEGKANETPPVS